MSSKLLTQLLVSITIAFLCFTQSAKAQDYTITTTGNAIVITDNSGNGETLDIAQSGANMRFVVTPTTRTYKINAGATMAFTTPADVALTGVTSISINAGAGDDIINVAAFTVNLPNLTVNGGTGDDAVNFNGNISFATNASLDVDLQNDDAVPGIDHVAFATNAQLILSGTGAAVIKVSEHVSLPSGNILRTQNGNLTIEANQQAIATTGTFTGVELNTNSIVEATGTGLVTVKGKGGNLGVGQIGISVVYASKISGGTTGTLTLLGTGGASSGSSNNGVVVSGTNASIISAGGDVSVTGQGGGTGASPLNYGVYIESTGTIAAGGNGTVTVLGTGGGSAGDENFGVCVAGAISIITSNGGNVSVTGHGGGSNASGSNIGVIIVSAATIAAGGSGTVTVLGTGGSSTGNSNYGVSVFDIGSGIISNGGNVSVTGQGGGSGSASGNNFGVFVWSGIIKGDGSGIVTLLGTGGSSTGYGNYGVFVYEATALITSAGGNISVTGTKGNGGSTEDILIDLGAAITSTGTGGNITLTSTSGGTYPNTSGTDIATTATKIFSFGAGSKLSFIIDGTTLTTQYQQLNVAGLINLNGATLNLNGSTYTPVAGNTFTLVDNDGTDAITGTFAGLAEGATITNFLGSALNATISYIGGTGNDVVLTVQPASLPDYTITTTGNAIVITDNSGNGETLDISQSGANLSFVVTPTARTYSVDGGATTAFTTPADVVLAGVTSITVNAGAGDDIINVAAFTASLPSLTINGGTGDDAVNFNGKISFATDANLNVDLQNDDAIPGIDHVAFATNAQVILSGTGAVIIKVSKNVNLPSENMLRTENGNITIEANQQATATTGNFMGVVVSSLSIIKATGSGTVTVLGKGGATIGNANFGVFVTISSNISSADGNVNVTGQGGGTGTSGRNYGVCISQKGVIQAASSTATGKATVVGTGGAGTGFRNYGVYLFGAGSYIATSGGNISVTGTKGAGTTAEDILLELGGEILSRGFAGDITLTATSGGIYPNTSGTDIETQDDNTISFGAGSILNIDIDGTTVNSQYQQLSVVGMVDLNNATLAFTGSTYVPVGGETFTIVDNNRNPDTEDDAITGTFAGLPEGAIIPNFLGSSCNATISYVGGTGNDVVITVEQPDYSITTTGNAIVITDNSGNGETLNISESGANLRFAVTPTNRTYSINGGAVTAFTTPADVALAGVTGITANTGAGNDMINVGAFTANLPNLTINGGIGDDGVNFNGNINFANNANLDVDMQNDDATPGIDNVSFANNAQLILSGNGAATIKVSQNVSMPSGNILRTQNGNLTIEANQQATATPGNFIGVELNTNSLVEATGTGLVTIKGKGGDNPAGGQQGVSVFNAGKITGGTTGTVIVLGTGGASTGSSNYGVYVSGVSSIINSYGNNVSVTGQGGGSGGSSVNFGVLVTSAATITAGGSGTVTVFGTGGASTAPLNYGVRVNGAGSIITSNGGNVSVTGQGGGTGAASGHYGVSVEAAGKITAGGSGNVTVAGTGGASTGGLNFGVNVSNTNSIITSNGGNVTVTGQGGGSSTSNSNIGVLVSAATITAGGSGTVTVFGTGGASTGNLNFGVYLSGAGSLITSAGGYVSVTGTKGNGAATQDILIESGAVITSTGTGGDITLTSTSGGTYPNTSGTDISTTATKTLSFGAGSKLNIDIDGTTVNTQYRQLGVVGMVDLTNATLTFTGSTYLPVAGNTFTIVDNDGTDAVIGTFAGLAEGATITNFLGSALNATISYVGGTGNDVVLTVLVAPLPDYSITTTGNAIVITDNSGNGETLAISQSGANIHFVVTPTTRTYTINGGATTAFSTQADVALAGVTSITANAGGGNDIINVAAFTANLPSLTINGGIGNDAVNFNGNISFAANANLDVDLQNDDAIPGVDNVAFATNAQLILSGIGAAIIKVSKNVSLPSGNILRTQNGNLTIEANQQAIATTGSFIGIWVNVNSLVEATGTSQVTLKGKGGTGTLGAQYGIYVSNAGKISGGTTGTVTVLGTGGASTAIQNHGVFINGSNATITSAGANVSIAGQGGGSSTSGANYGVHLLSSAIITAGGSGAVTVLGTGGDATGNSNIGVYILGANTLITSNGGNVGVTGQGGDSPSPYNYGVLITTAGTITAGGGGTVTVLGTGGAATGIANCGVQVTGASSIITSNGGNVSVTGQGGGIGASGSNIGVGVESAATITAGGSGTVTVLGTGGVATGSANYGVRVLNAGSGIISNGGNVSVTGQGGGSGSASSNNLGVYVPSGIIKAGGSGTVTLLGTGGSSTRDGNFGVYVSGPTALITSTGGNISVTGTKGNGTATQDILIELGAAITSTGAGGDITLTSTSGGTYPITSGTDIATTATKALSFGAGSKLNINIDGTTVNTQYQQLNVAGMVNLTNATLTFIGSTYVPVGGETFTLVDNDGTDAVIGTFAGLAEGTTITNFLGSALNATISYIGGTGNDVVLTVINPCTDPDVPTLSASVNPTCAGSPTTLSVQIGNLNSATSWQWYTGSCGGTSVGSGTSITVSPSTTTTYYARGEGGCVTPGSCANITVTVNSTVAASVNIAAIPAGSICSGTPVTFTATPTNGGVSPTYQWNKGGVPISGATGSTYTSSTLANNDVITVVMTATPSACLTGSPATSSGITMTVNSTLTASVNIAAIPAGAICSGTPVTFTATPTNGGGSPTYQWNKGGITIAGATGSTYTSATLVNNDVITVVMTATPSTCLTVSPAASNGITMAINSTLAASVNNAAVPAGAICSGTPVTFTATPTNGGGSPTYQWNKGGVPISGATGSTYTSSILANNDVITVVMTATPSACLTGSPAASNGITMAINSTLAASVNIAANPAGAICSGTSVTFTATPVNGGASPAYQWKKGGVVISGATGSTYTSSTLANNDVITVSVTATPSACLTGSPATSSGITMTVNSALPASVNIAAIPAGAICSGTSVTFTATPVNGGASPSYQWKKGGVVISGATGSTYTSSALANNDVITVSMTATPSTCLTGSPATSSGITMTVNSTLAASVDIAAVPSGSICAGISVTFTATAVNGGNNPSYQWKKNGTNVGSSSATYSAGNLLNHDTITVQLTSNAGCVYPTTAPDTLVVTVNAISTSTSFYTMACNSYTLPWGDVVTASNDYSHTYSNTGGCDSMVTAHVTIKRASTPTSFSAAACNSYTLPWGTVVTTTNGYTHNYTNSSGCDSVVTAQVTIKKSSTPTSFSAATCNSYTLPWGTVVTTTNDYTHVYTNINGCDSMVTAHVTISQGGASTSFTASACNSYTLPWGTVVTASGEYTHTYTNINGCDSLVKAIITIRSLPSAGTINVATSNICSVSIVNFTTNGNAGGTWTSSNFLIVAVHPVTGAAIALIPGTATISYTVSNSCGKATATRSVTVNPLPFAGLLNCTTTALCAGSTVTITTNGSRGGTWSSSNTAIAIVNVSTGVVTGIAAGTATIKYTVTNSCGTATATRAVTVNALPVKPVITAGGPTTFYQGGSVKLSAPAGFAGYLWSNGASAQTITVSASSSYSVSVTNSTGCKSAVSATVTVTVQPVPITLSVSHMDGDNRQPANDNIRPYLQLNNEGTAPVAYKDLTVRYWLTVEDFAPLNCNLVIDWAQLGANKIKMKYVKLAQPRNGAYGYIEYSFDASSGNLAGKSNSGAIQSRAGKNDWTNFNESDDYSYANASAYTKNNKITLYQNGSLVWGTEPVAIASVKKLKAYSQDMSNNATTNSLSPWLKLNNEGNLPVSYKDITIRYWFTADGTKPLNYYLDYARMGAGNVKYKFVKTAGSFNNADNYLELSFNAADSLYPASTTGNIQHRIAKGDWSNFNQLNDHSYKPGSSMSENIKVTVYSKGALVYGTEPNNNAARVAKDEYVEKEITSGLKVTLLNNPVTGTDVEFIVEAARGEHLNFAILDAAGRLISGRQAVQAGAAGRQHLSVGNSAAEVLYLRVITAKEVKTVRVMRSK